MELGTRTLVVTGLVALLLATAGCADGGESNLGEAPEASALQANATEAMQDVESASLEMNMTLSGGQQGQSISMNGAGVIDQTQKAMRLNTTMNLGGQSMDMTQYVIGNTSYLHMQGEWIRQDLSGMNYWEQGNNELQMQEEVLENATVNVTGSDQIGDHDVWVLSVQPDPEALQAITNQQNVPGAQMGENVDLSDVEMTQYVDAETYQVRRIVADMTTNVQNQSVSMSMTMTFSDFNDSVTIDLPAAAENATPMGEMMGQGGNATATDATASG